MSSNRERQVNVRRSNNVQQTTMTETEFDTMRNRFESEMRRVEEEMQRLRREFESYTPRYGSQDQRSVQGTPSSAPASERGPEVQPGHVAAAQRAITSAPPPHAYQTNTQHYREHQSTSGRYPPERERPWTADPALPAAAASPMAHYGGPMQSPARPAYPGGGQVATRSASRYGSPGYPRNPYDPYFDTGPPPQGHRSHTIRDDSDRKTLRLRFNVSQYDPEEISVRTVDNRLLVQAKHEEKAPGKTVFREYNQEFMLPKGLRADDITSSLSNDGILTVEAPLPALPPPQGASRPAITHR